MLRLHYSRARRRALHCPGATLRQRGIAAAFTPLMVAVWTSLAPPVLAADLPAVIDHSPLPGNSLTAVGRGGCDGSAEVIFDATLIDPTATLIDFESQPTGAATNPLSLGAVTFSANEIGIASVIGFAANGTEVEGNTLQPLSSAVFGGTYRPITMEFAAPVTHVGFGLFDPNVPGNTVAAYDASGGCLGSAEVTDLGPPGGSTATFIGFVSASPTIARVVYTPVSPGDWYSIDNVRFATIPIIMDTDADGVFDDIDNCTDVPNPGQRDTDGDAIGNFCDADISVPNDCFVDFLDLGTIKAAFVTTPVSPDWNPDADLDASGIVDFPDLGNMKSQFFGPPGPSASGCN